MKLALVCIMNSEECQEKIFFLVETSRSVIYLIKILRNIEINVLNCTYFSFLEKINKTSKRHVRLQNTKLFEEI